MRNDVQRTNQFETPICSICDKLVGRRTEFWRGNTCNRGFRI